jgi:tRNA (cytidine/uridine-2'-O-)-methyltransferase
VGDNARVLHVVLYQPEIPPNTGNVIRLCANSGAALHLVRPLGFDLDHAKLRRAGLDYHEFAEVAVHDDLGAFVATVAPRRLFALSTRSHARYDEVAYADGDAFLFGPETRGLPQDVLDAIDPELRLRLPMRPGNRSLNLSNAVAVVVYEAWRQLGFAGAGEER